MRELRVLLGTEGPHDNVLKVRPPMTFDAAAASRLLETLDEVLGRISRSLRRRIVSAAENAAARRSAHTGAGLRVRKPC